MECNEVLFKRLKKDFKNPEKAKLVQAIIRNHFSEFFACEEIDLFDLVRMLPAEDHILFREMIRTRDKSYRCSVDYMIKFNLLSSEFLSAHWKEAIVDSDYPLVFIKKIDNVGINDILDNLEYFCSYCYEDIIDLLIQKGANDDDLLELAKRWPHFDEEYRSYKIPDYVFDVLKKLVEEYNLDKARSKELVDAFKDCDELIEGIINHEEDWEQYGVDYKEYLDQYLEKLHKEYHVNKDFTRNFIVENGYYYFSNTRYFEKAAKTTSINDILINVPIRELRRNLGESYTGRIFEIIDENGGDISIIEKRFMKERTFKTLQTKNDFRVATALLQFKRRAHIDAKTYYKAAMRYGHEFSIWHAELFR